MSTREAVIIDKYGYEVRLPVELVVGQCPACPCPQWTRADRCPRCGNQLDVTDLINPCVRVNKFADS